jgi:hypothetical protein
MASASVGSGSNVQSSRRETTVGGASGVSPWAATAFALVMATRIAATVAAAPVAT